MNRPNSWLPLQTPLALGPNEDRIAVAFTFRNGVGTATQAAAMSAYTALDMITSDQSPAELAAASRSSLTHGRSRSDTYAGEPPIMPEPGTGSAHAPCASAPASRSSPSHASTPTHAARTRAADPAAIAAR